MKIHTYFNVREDAMQLYGFRSKDDLQMFKLLLGREWSRAEGGAVEFGGNYCG